MDFQLRLSNFEKISVMVKLLMEQPHKAKFEQYKHERSFKLMFQYLWELNETSSILNVDIKPPLKNEALSEELRKQGNKFYQRKYFQQALDKYNLSIMEAPHPDITQGEYSAEIPEVVEDHDKTEYKALALGYANRSAVLYELKQYRKSITDIDCALKFGYPKILHCKIAERKIKCLIALKKHQEAKTLLQTTVDALSSLPVSDIKESLEKLKANCLTDSIENEQHTSDETYENHPPRNLSSLSNDELLFAFKNPPPPVLEDVNPTIPAFSSALGLTFSEYSGRSVVATRDIKPGELLGVEAPYVSMLMLVDSTLSLSTIVRNFCCVCTARCLTPLPCALCKTVIFCSDSCRNEGISKFHRVECSVLPTLIEIDMGMVPILTYRLLAQIPFLQLKSIIPKLEEETHQIPRQFQGFNDQGIYDSLDYKTVFNLEGNFCARDLNDVIEKCCTAFILTKLLIKSACYFVDEFGKSFEPSLSDIILVGSTVFMHLTNVASNCMEINESQVPVGKSTFDLDSKFVGTGVYPAMSLFNHSCYKSATQVNYGCHQVTYSLKFIPKGSEVSISYGESCCEKSVDLRRSVLLRKHQFKCNCEACTNNWSPESFIDIFPKLKQSEKIILDGATGKMAELYPVNRKRIVSYMKELHHKMTNMHLGIMYETLDADSAIAIEAMEFIGRFAAMPCSSMLVMAREMLEMCVHLNQGSCNFLK